MAAANAAAQALGLTPTASFESGAQASGATRSRTLNAAGISHDAIPVQLTYHLVGKKLVLSWQLVINQLDGKHWWNIAMDAGDGAEVDRSDWVDEDSHNIFPFPTEAPSFGSRQVVTNPATSASPFGWNDTNGVAGAELTTTVGNNVSATPTWTPTTRRTPTAARTAGRPGVQLPAQPGQPALDVPTGGRGQPVLREQPDPRRHAPLRLHEAVGNFQINNYGNGGAGNDSVNAEAQDGEGTDNANFGTPPDGTSRGCRCSC